MIKEIRWSDVRGDVPGAENISTYIMVEYGDNAVESGASGLEARLNRLRRAGYKRDIRIPLGKLIEIAGSYGNYQQFRFPGGDIGVMTLPRGKN